MTQKQIIMLTVILICFVLSAIFSLLDMTYSTVKISRLEESFKKKEPFSKEALKHAKNYDKTIATILFGNDFVNIFASSLISILGMELLSNYFNEEISTIIITVSSLFILLIFCEYIPKALGRGFSLLFSKVFAYFITVLEYLFYIFITPVGYLSNWLCFRLLRKTGKEEEICSDDELLNMVDEIEEEGIIDKDKSELLQSAIEFKETSVYLAMTPRVKIVGYDINTPIEKLMEDPQWSTYSRIIVYDKDMDHVLGYFHVNALLKEMVLNNKFDIKNLIHPILSIPSTMQLSSVLITMKRKRQHILLVKDEYGGTDGIITMEDILEEIVGEIWDENDRPKDDIIPGEEDNEYIVSGEMNIFDFFDFFKLNEDSIDEDYATVSGYIINRLGRFAKDDDEMLIEDVLIKDFKIKNNMIQSLLAVVLKKEDEEDDEYSLRLKSYKEELEDIISNKGNLQN
ncbi:MAG: hemolysin family protein [Candidatus Enterosoma sp.]|nr:hemolysin family protein [Bacilli bacterium]MDY3907132.1 hemolysin family protein [Candidatus Enterosoma sp.]